MCSQLFDTLVLSCKLTGLQFSSYPAFPNCLSLQPSLFLRPPLALNFFMLRCKRSQLSWEGFSWYFMTSLLRHNLRANLLKLGSLGMMTVFLQSDTPALIAECLVCVCVCVCSSLGSSSLASSAWEKGFSYVRKALQSLLPAKPGRGSSGLSVTWKLGSTLGGYQ